MALTSHLDFTRVSATLELTDMMQVVLQRGLAISVTSGQQGERCATLGPSTCWSSEQALPNRPRLAAVSWASDRLLYNYLYDRVKPLRSVTGPTAVSLLPNHWLLYNTLLYIQWLIQPCIFLVYCNHGLVVSRAVGHVCCCRANKPYLPQLGCDHFPRCHLCSQHLFVRNLNATGRLADAEPV